MAVREWLGLAAGGLLAAVGLGAWLGSTSPAAVDPTPAAVTNQTVVSVVQEDPALTGSLTGLPGAVSRVLEQHGHLEVMSQSQLTGSLPESVARVLISGDAVLDVKEAP